MVMADGPDMITGMRGHRPARIGIVADDLTSATDGAAPFLRTGAVPVIALEGEGLDAEAVVSIDANSRALAVADATRATTEATLALARREILLKTIDSTLRGHVRAEIAAAGQASGRGRLIVAPAFPDAGRLTIGGVQFVNGVEVTRSDYGRDPVHPAGTSDLRDLIDPVLGAPVVLAHDDVFPKTWRSLGASVVILDAETQEDLNRQVSAVPDKESVLWVGSPGLALALASWAEVPASDRPGGDFRGERALVVVGSANLVAHAQCEALRARGVCVVTDLADARGDHVILCLRAPRLRQADPASVLADLAGQATAALASPGFDVVIATGGETMRAILGRAGVARFTLLGELEPGFPFGCARRADGSTLLVALKAGGFGAPDALVRALDALLRSRPQLFGRTS